ncbi:23S rRNA methyltransferase [Achromatium sp. WMS2]|nr:23S rRNA methyltransferase [Achromatium sp. WMS2]
MSRSLSSRNWLKRHINDAYVQQAQKDGYRSRAAYKLLEIQAKDRLLRPGQRIIDLGAAPGSWCQVASKSMGNNGYIVGLDLLPIDPIPGVHLLQGDFRETAILAELSAYIEQKPVDLILSDLAPNFTGINAVDQPRAMYLCELALELCQIVLKQNGALIVKVFQGSGFAEYLKALREHFQRVVSRKPKASRVESSEFYLVATGFKHAGSMELKV